jgi:pimeloyl-ACP methyl ester carboxylesterase
MGMKSLGVVVLKLFILQIILLGRAHASEPESMSEKSCQEVHGEAGAIDEAGYINIGGIKQWLTIKGNSCANPVVLFVHGGPGNPMSIYSGLLYKDWEDKFTIVQWDQRGSGKTFETNLPSGEITDEILSNVPLTMALIVKDGLQVSDFLRKKMSKEKIIITGSSWGSAVAVNMISTQSELFQFYVGLSQLVNYQADVLDSYQKVLARVKQNGDVQAQGLLESMGSPPWVNPRYFGKLRKISRKLETQATENPVVLQVGKEYQTEKYEAAYESGEEFSFIKFVGLEGDGIGPGIALDMNNTVFSIPIYLIQGDEDLVTSPEITKPYFEKLKAPYKSYISVPRSGHDPNQNMLSVQLTTLLEGLSLMSK